MAFFKKPVAQVDNDDDIRREIRARVAKQAGIYDEEYIKTGKIGGNKNEAEAASVDAPSHVSAAAVPIITEHGNGEVELSFEPNQSAAISEKPFNTEPDSGVVAEPKAAAAIEIEKTAPAKPIKEKKPPKEMKQKAPKEKNPPKEKKQQKAKGSAPRPKKKRVNVALILFIIVLLLAFIPLYYFLTGGNNQTPTLNVTSADNTLLLAEPLLVEGTAYDSDNAEGTKIYYSLDNGDATLLYSFEAGPGPFEKEIVLPDTVDFVGNHSITLYAEDTKGEVSGTTILNFSVSKPALTGLEITAPPTKVEYKVGDKLNLEGLVITASYEDGKKAPVTTFTSDTPDDTKLTESGKLTITISFIEDKITQTAKFDVTVAKAPVVTPPPVTPTRQVNDNYPVPSLDLYKAGASSVDLQWSGLSGVDGYQIQRKTGSGGNWSTVKTLSFGYTSWTDSGPSAGKTYYYKICSYKVVNGVRVYSRFSSSRSIAL